MPGASDAVTPADGPVPARVRWLLVAVLLLGLGLRGLGLGDPWSGRGFNSAFGTWTTGNFAVNHVQHGLLESGLMPYYWRVELEDGSVARKWYAHHPALFVLPASLSMRIFGVRPWAARLPWLLLSTLSLVAAWRLFRTVWDDQTALLGTLFLAVIPLAVHHGTLLYPDHAILALQALLVRRYVLWQRDGRFAHLAWGALHVFLGGLLDWPMHVVLVGIGLHAAWWCLLGRGGGWRPLLSTLVLPGAALATIVVHLVHMRLVLPPEVLEADSARTVVWTTTMKHSLADFLGLQWDHLRRLVTLPVLAAVGFGLAVQVRGLLGRRPVPGGGALLCTAVSGLIYVGLFPARSQNHGFFWAFSLLYVCATVALVARGLLRRPEWSGRFAGILGVALLAGWCGWRDLSLWRGLRSDEVERLVESPWLSPVLADDSAVVLTSAGPGLSIPFYSRAPVLGPYVAKERLLRDREAILSRLGAGRPVVFLFFAGAFRAHRELFGFLETCATPELHEVGRAGRPPIKVAVFDLTAWAGER